MLSQKKGQSKINMAALPFVLLLVAISTVHGANYRVGIGIADTTGPAAEVGMVSSFT